MKRVEVTRIPSIPLLDEQLRPINRPAMRRERVPGCALCDRLINEGTTFAPPHDASHGCESGKYDHCTCDTCF